MTVKPPGEDHQTLKKFKMLLISSEACSFEDVGKFPSLYIKGNALRLARLFDGHGESLLLSDWQNSSSSSRRETSLFVGPTESAGEAPAC